MTPQKAQVRKYKRTIVVFKQNRENIPEKKIGAPEAKITQSKAPFRRCKGRTSRLHNAND